MKLQNWVLQLWSNYEIATDRFFHLRLPAPRPPATPYAGAGHLGGQVPSPRPKPHWPPLDSPPNQLSWRCTAATRAPARHAIAVAERRAESAFSPRFAPYPGCSLPSSPSLSLPPIKRAPAPRACPARPPALATIAGRRRSSVEPPFRPSSAPIEPLNGFLSPPCTSPAQPRRLSLAGVAPPATRTSAGRPSPWTRLLRPSPDEPRPPKGSSRAPHPFPPLSPRRRPTSSPGNAAPFLALFCDFRQGPQIKRTKTFRGPTAKYT